MAARTVILFAVATLAASVPACRKTEIHPYPAPRPISFVVPEGFPPMVYDLAGNPITEEGFALGRKLFHNQQLTINNDVSCGGCHQQEAAFTTFDHDLGHGTNHQHTTRNVPGIFNMAWHPAMRWDGGAKTLQEQVLSCMTAPERMGETPEGVSKKLQATADYPDLFGKAFGDKTINGERIAKALSQFVVSMVSANSRYDKMKKGQAEFNSSEQAGYQIFQQHCSSCHQEPMFTDFSYRNNGIGVNPFHLDIGRMDVTGDIADSLKFKVPSLRNVSLTGYYAHDGRYSAMSQMIDHYSGGIVDGPTLDPSLKQGIALTDLEKFYLTEFLYTLADSTLVTDPRFAK